MLRENRLKDVISFGTLNSKRKCLKERQAPIGILYYVSGVAKKFRARPKTDERQSPYTM